MPATATNGSPGLARIPHGSLNTMRLGAQTLDQLADLINWDNAPNFPAREVNPWTGLDFASSPHSQSTLAAAPEAAKSETLQSITAESTSVNVIVDQPVVNAIQESDETDAEPTESPSHLEAHPQPLSQSGEVVNDEQVLREPSRSQVSSDDQELKVVHEVVSRQDTQRATTALNRREVVKTGDTSSRSSQYDQGFVCSTEQAKQAGAASKDRPNAEPKETSPATSVPPAQIRFDAMTNKPSPASSAQANVDPNYLHRLESLVLELNLQLARINTPINDNADYSQWLSQRVIDLSLQNMALQEELAKLRTK